MYTLKQLPSKILKFGTLAMALLLLTFSQVACGPDEPDDDDPITNEKEQFLDIDGTRYPLSDFYEKSHTINPNGYERLYLRLVDNFDEFALEFEHDDGDSIVARAYKPDAGASYLPDFDTYSASVFFAAGSPPQFCQYRGDGLDPETTANVVISKVNGKVVCEFGPCKLKCVTGYSGPDNHIVSGYLVFEDL